jgi:hypothetical protein
MRRNQLNGKKKNKNKNPPQPKRSRAQRRNLNRRKAKTNNGWVQLENNQRLSRVSNLVKDYGPVAAKLAGGFVANKVVGMLKGFGDYKLTANSLLNGVPHFANSSGRFIFQRQEYLGDISPTDLFNITRYPLNPGQSKTFPWLYNIAKNFEQWKPHGIAFYFRSLSSPNVLSEAPNTSLGAVVLSTQYDPKDPAFESKVDMENYWCTGSGPPYKDQIHPVECAKNQTLLNELLVRVGDLNDADLSFYDLGNFDIATVGCPGEAGTIGELWITYCIEFMKPKVPEDVNNPRDTDFWGLNGVTVARCLGATAPSVIVNTLGGVLDTTDAGTIDYSSELRDGDNLIVNYCLGGSAAAIAGPTVTLTGFEYNTEYNSAPGYWFNGGTTNTYILTMSLKVTEPDNCSITFVPGTVIPASLARAIIFISKVDGDFTVAKKTDYGSEIEKLKEQIMALMTPLHITNDF